MKRLHHTGRPDLALRTTPPRLPGTAPTLVFFPGYASDMAGSKAQALFAHAEARGLGCVLFDYAGCGESAGSFADETLATWLQDAGDVIDANAANQPLVLIGSSMGGWLTLLTALRLGQQVEGLIGIAAAPDFTDWGYDEEEKEVLRRDGRLLQPNPYGPEPTLTTRALWESGAPLRLLDAPIAITCPVRLIHGTLDEDVPVSVAHRLMDRLGSADVALTLVKDGDHRLSRPADIDLLLGTVDALIDRRQPRKSA